MHLSFRNIRSLGHSICVRNEHTVAKYAPAQSKTCSDTAGSPDKGEITEFSGWFSDPVKAKIPFNFKVTLQEDQIEILEEDFVCLNSYKQKYTYALATYLSANKGEWWNKKPIAALAFNTHTHRHIYTSPPPSWVPSDSWGITCLITLICLPVPKLFSPPSDQRAGCIIPQAGDTHSSWKFIYPLTPRLLLLNPHFMVYS